MNRHYPETLHEVWESYEWLLKSKLQELDHMARQMFKSMQATNAANNDKIRRFMQEMFAALWEQVAAQEEVKAKRRELE